MGLNFFAMLRSPSSWSEVSREMILALDRAGCDVSITNCRGFLHEIDFALPLRLVELMDKPRHTDLELAFTYPPNYRKLLGRRRAGMLVYESTVVPAHWVAAVNEYLHLLLVPTRWCRDIMCQSGCDASRVAIVPYGADPERFNPSAPALDLPGEAGFRFLCVGTPHIRKGHLELIEAFCQEFGDSDDVRLTIKTTYLPERRGKRSFWEIPDLPGFVDACRRRAGSTAPIDILVEQRPPVEMAGYYTAADCCVQPSYSEGFGVAMFEAMACGRPLIATGWSGHMDYCTPANCFLLDYDLAPADSAQYDVKSPGALVAKPRVEHLRELMRYVLEHPDEARARGAAAAQTARAMTWDAAAARTVELLKQL